MSNVERVPDARGAERLRAEALDALASATTSLRHSPTLSAAFETAQSVPRARELRRVGIVGLFAYLVIVVLLNELVIAHPNWSMVILQLAVFPPCVVGFIHGFARPDISASLREGATTALGCLLCLVVLASVGGSPARVAVMNLFMVTLPVVSVFFFVRLRFLGACVAALVTVGALAAVLVLREDLPSEFKYYPLGFLIAAIAPSLFAVWELERNARQVFLHGLMQASRIEELAAQNGELDELAETDVLTGAGNRRRLEKLLKARLAGESRNDCLLLIDVDHFKALNDMHGHRAGDVCLRETAALIAGHLRRGGHLIRFGGDEFAILLTDAAAGEARQLAARLCHAVAEHRILFEGRVLGVTLTVGGAEFDKQVSVETLLADADSALYAAKRAGRNRVGWACAA